jgi:galactitol-specific phosphotransferase system IIB component
MMASMDIENIISQKQAMLDLARAKVAELEQQIATLKSVLMSVRVQDEFDQVLSKQAQSQQLAAQITEVLTPFHPDNLQADDEDDPPLRIEATQTGRNPKGQVRKVLLDIFSGGQEIELDAVESALNARVANRVTRGGVRTALMNLKNEGLISSRKNGYYQLAKKGETLGESSDGNPKAEGFKLQPSPSDGA